MANVGAAPSRRDREHARWCAHCNGRMPVAQYHSVHVCTHLHILTAGDVHPRTNTEGSK